MRCQLIIWFFIMVMAKCNLVLSCNLHLIWTTKDQTLCLTCSKFYHHFFMSIEVKVYVVKSLRGLFYADILSTTQKFPLHKLLFDWNASVNSSIPLLSSPLPIVINILSCSKTALCYTWPSINSSSMAHCCRAPSTRLAFWSVATPSRSSRAAIKRGNSPSQQRLVTHSTDAGEQSL